VSHYLFDYSRSHDPAAPVIPVIIKTGYGMTSLLPAFLDTGADGSMIPLAILQQIGARYSDKRLLSGITSESEMVGLYPVQIQLEAETIYGIEAAGYGSEIILGRDVLNQLEVLLNGPALTIEIRV
jgi:predicted aspartyl protease